MTIRCYGQRLLNPFRGVMNIIEQEGAEAVTVDGIHWDIYVRDIDLLDDMTAGKQVQTSDIRYGSWSLKDGLKRGAIYPSEDFRTLEYRGAAVYEYLLKHHDEVPFTLTDHFELWLLDDGGQPLALLDSTPDEENIEFDRPIDWRAGRECCRHFQSPVMRELGGPPEASANAGEYLTRYINERAGAAPQAQWFRRRKDGGGEGMQGIRLQSHLHPRALGHRAFPPLFLREDGHSPVAGQLIQDFIAWQTPCLLLLQHLDRPTRRRFEQLARSRALALDNQYHLYPDVIDENGLNIARVEAALRRNQPCEEETDDTMATYYIELNVTRTN